MAASKQKAKIRTIKNETTDDGQDRQKGDENNAGQEIRYGMGLNPTCESRSNLAR
jgi:hypothetical protein